MTFPPLINSCAQQLSDLSLSLSKQEHNVKVILYGLQPVATTGDLREYISAPTLPVHNLPFYLRIFSELINPFLVTLHLLRSQPLSPSPTIAIAYSPTIFHWPLLLYLRLRYNVTTYLILRDVFPEWTYPLKILRKGIRYSFLKLNANLLYFFSHIIALQSPSDIRYLWFWVKPKPWSTQSRSREVQTLYNWQDHKYAPDLVDSAIKTRLQKPIPSIVYAGNVGIAQNIFPCISALSSLGDLISLDLYIFGSHVNKLTKLLDLSNMHIRDIEPPDVLYSALLESHFGLVSLDTRLENNNIPGKLLSYLFAGLPILCKCPRNTDLYDIISDNGLGFVVTSEDVNEILSTFKKAFAIFSSPVQYYEMSRRCYSFAHKNFSSSSAARSIVKAVNAFDSKRYTEYGKNSP